MVKILHILNSVTYDGAAIHAFRVVKMSPQFNHYMISIFTGSAVNEFKKNGVNCSILLERKPVGVSSKIRKIISTAMFLRKQNYDMLHFHGGGISVLFLLTLFKRKASLIFHMHSGNVTGVPFKQKVPPAYRLLYRLMDSHIAKIATCEHVREFYMQQIKPSKRDSIHLIRNFTPYEFNIRNRLSFRVGYIGRIAHEKNVDLFFELCKNKKLSELNLKFAMMGDVSEQFSENVADMVSEGIIEYFPPSLKVEEFYEMIDILIFPSGLTETMPQVILEAVSFDVTVIAFKTSATKEIFGSYPMLIDKPDISFFIEKIKEYYSSEKLRLKLSAIHSEVARKFNQKQYSSKIVELYSSLASR